MRRVNFTVMVPMANNVLKCEYRIYTQVQEMQRNIDDQVLMRVTFNLGDISTGDKEKRKLYIA